MSVRTTFSDVPLPEAVTMMVKLAGSPAVIGSTSAVLTTPGLGHNTVRVSLDSLLDVSTSSSAVMVAVLAMPSSQSSAVLVAVMVMVRD